MDLLMIFQQTRGGDTVTGIFKKESPKIKEGIFFFNAVFITCSAFASHSIRSSASMLSGSEGVSASFVQQ